MVKFLVTNEINDINKIYVTHFSLDKGHYLAKSLAKFGHNVYFLTENDDYTKDGIIYISIKNITDPFLKLIDYILISREALLPVILDKIPTLKNLISINKEKRNTKFIIKSDCPLWFHDKEMRRYIHKTFGQSMTTSRITKWIISHIDYICAQNENFRIMAIQKKLPESSLIITNMGVPNQYYDYNKLSNPYTINHSYCVNDPSKLGNNKALLPRYYITNPNEKQEFNTKKHIIVYTGRIKVNGGKILFNMLNIMEKLGNKYELHIFPGSFLLPNENGTTAHSARNGNSLGLLRDTIFKNSKNIIVHYPYEHQDKYRYLYFADCGIDFSEVRPSNGISMAGHAKILEYCEIGLPIVCEENINNLFLIRNGKNGIILPYLASDDEYANAIRDMIENIKIDREYCRKITVDNENWDNKAKEILQQLKL